MVLGAQCTCQERKREMREHVGVNVKEWKKEGGEDRERLKENESVVASV